MTSHREPKDWTPEYFISNTSDCYEILKNPDTLKRIPLLDNAPLHNFKDGQLVRFKGMIQDMYNPEYYFEHYEVEDTETGTCEVRCGRYTNSTRCLPHEEILEESENNVNSTRYTYVVITVPGLKSWAKEKCECVSESDKKVTSNVSFKRNLDVEDTEDMDCVTPVAKKVALNDDEKMDTTPSDTNEENVVSKDHILNFPIPMDDGMACIVKVYCDLPLKLNQVIHVIGFLSLDPVTNNFNDSDGSIITEAEMNTHNPPVSLVPRLHAIKIIEASKSVIPNAPEIISKAELIRSDLHRMFTQLLFGDPLAADFLICHLLSSVYMRKDFRCLGNYPLNITHFPAAKYKSYAKDFYGFLSQFLRKSHFVQITLDNLNDMAFLPKKDYECNRLTSGILQLSNNTHLVIDETGLTTGQVSQAGRQNHKALTDLSVFQRVKYDFDFYHMEYETDIPLLIFSEAKSFIPCETQMIIDVDPDTERLYPQLLEISKQFLKDENRLANMRNYFEALRDLKFEINQTIAQKLQEDFILIRRLNKNVSVDHLHALMVLSRLLSLSHGSNKLTIEHLRTAVQMDMDRITRLPPSKYG